MATNASDLLSTPEAYATPQQLAAAREFYSNMLKQSVSTDPIQSRWQGVARMAQALFGGLGLSQSAKAERAAKLNDAESVTPALGGAPEPPKLPGMPGGATPGFSLQGDTPRKQALGFNPDAAGSAVSGIESGGSYSLLGPMTKSGDRAYGKYQVMGANVGPWTKEALGKPMTPQEFVADKDAQEAVFKHKFGQYAAKYGPEGAARAWFAGEGGMNKPGRKDQLGTTVQNYGDRFTKGYNAAGGAPGGAPGGALPFNGEPTNLPQPGTPDPMASALAGPGATVPMPRTVPTVPGGAGGSAIPPGVIPTRPRYSSEQIKKIMASDYISPADKQQAMQLYMMQNQPVEVGTMGGKYVIGQDGHPYYVPDVKWNQNKAGSVETNIPTIIDQNGRVKELEGGSPGGGTPGTNNAVPDLNYASPEGGKADLGKGAVNELPPLPPEITTGQSQPAMIPKVPDFNAERPPPMPPNEPPDTTHGIDRGLKGDSLKAPGMLNYAPPDGGDLTVPAPTPGKAGTAGKTAQASPRMQGLIDLDMNIKQREEQVKKEADSFQKKYDVMTEGGQTASGAKPMLQLARDLTLDPQYYSGIGGNMVLDFKKLKAAVGIDPRASTAMEAFDKVMSGQLLNNMRTTLHGLGQVRVAEIDLLQRAAASLNMSPGANRLVLDLMLKAMDKSEALGQMATHYARGARWTYDKDSDSFKANRDAKGNTIFEKGPHTLPGLDAHINEYLNKKPILTKEDQAELKKMMANPTGYGAPPAAEKKGTYATERPEPKLTPTQKQAPAAPRPATAPPKGYE